MEIKGVNYRVWYDPANVVVSFEGILRLGGPQEYQPIEELLEKVLLTDPKTITLDLRALSFLNSSGITMFSRFVIEARDRVGITLQVLASETVPWHARSLKNLQRLMPSLSIRLT